MLDVSVDRDAAGCSVAYRRLKGTRFVTLLAPADAGSGGAGGAVTTPADTGVWSFRQQWPVEKGRLKAELFRASVEKREPLCRSHRLQRVSVVDHIVPTNERLFVGESENGSAKFWRAIQIGETA